MKILNPKTFLTLNQTLNIARSLTLSQHYT